jgi:hypothetical protein
MPVTRIAFTLPSDAVFPFTDRELMREIGLLAREKILRRTASGVDSSGDPFKPYSEGYAKQKGKALGASAGGTVNLQASGDMLNALTITDVGDEHVELGFSR